jgi:type II secretory pathway pseudopilin PulG
MAETTEEGFILIEALVAIALFAATAVCVIRILHHSFQSASRAREEFAAGVMLENALRTLDEGAGGAVETDDSSWRITPLDGVPVSGNLLRIEMRAFHEGREAGSLAFYRAVP